MEQQGQEKSLHQEGMAKAWITYAWTEKCCTSLTSQLRHDYSTFTSYKIGLFKNSVKTLDKNGARFHYLKEKFPCVSDSKIKEGNFVGPQIRVLIWDGNFEDMLSQIKKNQCGSHLKVLWKFFLGNHKVPNYHEIVGQLLQSYQDMGWNMSLKIHFLDSHLDFFPDNLGAVSDEHGERFHQDISALEKRYQGQRSARMLADYCWTMKRDVPDAKHRRQSTTLTF